MQDHLPLKNNLLNVSAAVCDSLLFIAMLTVVQADPDSATCRSDGIFWNLILQSSPFDESFMETSDLTGFLGSTCSYRCHAIMLLGNFGL